MQDNSGAGAKLIARGKRSTSWFEPIYDSTATEGFPLTEWPQQGQKCSNATLSVDQLEDEKLVFVEIVFENCDFQGRLLDKTPAFKNCKFEKCDFGLSHWKRVKFKRCSFYKTSFTLASFEDCEFRECTYTEIGLSGNETLLDGTFITNPADFLRAAYTNVDQDTLKSKKTTVQHQLMRLSQTKATVARSIMKNCANVGDEKTYYNSIKIYQNQSLEADILRCHYELSNKPGADRAILLLFELVTAAVEKGIINAAGVLNGWGASIARPTLIGCGMVILFSILYWAGGIRPTFLGALLTSIDITLLVGYTKHASNNLSAATKFIFGLNMILGIAWYSVFLPTLVNRISRVR